MKNLELNFETALNDFIAHINSVKKAYYVRMKFHPEMLKTLEEKEYVRLTGGRKYAKLTDGRSVVAFIEKSTGNILKPASWNAPAKHARGNIYNNGGKDAVGPAGSIKYLR
jgi:hypothetical protein